MVKFDEPEVREEGIKRILAIRYIYIYSYKTGISSCFVSVHVVHLYSSIDTTAAWKKLCFILSVRSDFYMIDSLLIAVHVFVSHVSMSFSVDETLLP